MVSRVERPHIEENERRPCFDYSPTEIWLFFFCLHHVISPN